jgi:putative membrane protein
MIANRYLRHQEKELTLNDLLAIDRTVLANERTLLAYGRTALAMAVIGGTCLKFFTEWPMHVLGVLFITTGIVLIAFGLRQFQRTRGYLAIMLEEQTGKPEHPLEGRREAQEKDNDA